MALVWWVNDRQPSISDQLTINGAPVDLSAASVQFKMRAIGSSTLKVNQPVASKDNLGNWRYDWGATDLDTANRYLAWIEVTASGKVQTQWESLLEVRAHAPDTHVYVELEQFKSTAELKGTSYADQDIQVALTSASSGVEGVCNRRTFFKDGDALQERFFEPISDRLVRIDDLVELTSVATDPDSDGVYDTVWVLGSDFELSPLNAPADGRPWESLRRVAGGRYLFMTGSWVSDFARNVSEPSSPRVRVTGRWGWPAVPANVVSATTILAKRILLRSRDAPFGILAGGEEAAYIAQNDPEVMFLLKQGRLIRGSGASGMGLT